MMEIFQLDYLVFFDVLIEVDEAVIVGEFSMMSGTIRVGDVDTVVPNFCSSLTSFRDNKDKYPPMT
jgi:hypothetical protein